jgi:hypothetical protein
MITRMLKTHLLRLASRHVVPRAETQQTGCSDGLGFGSSAAVADAKYGFVAR